MDSGKLVMIFCLRMVKNFQKNLDEERKNENYNKRKPFLDGYHKAFHDSMDIMNEIIKENDDKKTDQKSFVGGSKNANNEG